MYRESGLKNEPELIKRTVDSYKLESDNVALFMQDAIEEVMLIEDVDAHIPSSQLHGMYTEWCRRNNIPPLGFRRLKHRVERLGYEYFRSNGSKWRGLRQGTAGVLGTVLSTTTNYDADRARRY
jgi:phage/plasmid-associated DNA primase